MEPLGILKIYEMPTNNYNTLGHNQWRVQTSEALEVGTRRGANGRGHGIVGIGAPPGQRDKIWLFGFERWD